MKESFTHRLKKVIREAFDKTINKKATIGVTEEGVPIHPESLAKDLEQKLLNIEGINLIAQDKLPLTIGIEREEDREKIEKEVKKITSLPFVIKITGKIEGLKESSFTKKMEGKHSRDKCMTCNKPPVYEVLWAEGKGMAWFCKKHFKEWAKEDDLQHLDDIVYVKEITEGKASKNFSDNKNPNIWDKLKKEMFAKEWAELKKLRKKDTERVEKLSTYKKLSQDITPFMVAKKLIEEGKSNAEIKEHLKNSFKEYPADEWSPEYGFDLDKILETIREQKQFIEKGLTKSSAETKKERYVVVGLPASPFRWEPQWTYAESPEKAIANVVVKLFETQDRIDYHKKGLVESKTYLKSEQGKLIDEMKKDYKAGNIEFIKVDLVPVEKKESILLKKIGQDIEPADGFRGVSVPEAIDAAQGRLHPTSPGQQMPLDWEVVEYSLGDKAHEMSEEEIEAWVRATVSWYDGSIASVEGGLNITTDFMNAKGYAGNGAVLKLEVMGEMAEFSEAHVYAKDAKDVEVVSIIYEGKEYTPEEFLKVVSKKTSSFKKAEEKYYSDGLRGLYVKEGLTAEINTEEPSRQELQATDDWILVRNHGDSIVYYEYWGIPCWYAVYKKYEYKDLTRDEVIEKFMRERFTPLVTELGEKVLNYTYQNGMLRVEISNSKKIEGAKKGVETKLKKYRQKRDFDKTTEPKGDTGTNENVYVIQEHCTLDGKCHYDIRIGYEEVLESWCTSRKKNKPPAIPTKEGDSIYVIQTEPHPLSYQSFSGKIPEGEYGAGTIKIHTKGTRDIIEWKPGKVKVYLKGGKYSGIYSFSKMGKGKVWKMVKSKEKEATQLLIGHRSFKTQEAGFFGTSLKRDDIIELKNRRGRPGIIKWVEDSLIGIRFFDEPDWTITHFSPEQLIKTGTRRTFKENGHNR